MTRFAFEIRYNNANDRVSHTHHWNDYVQSAFLQYRGEYWQSFGIELPIDKVVNLFVVDETGIEKRSGRCIAFLQPLAFVAIANVATATCSDCDPTAYASMQVLNLTLKRISGLQ